MRIFTRAWFVACCWALAAAAHGEILTVTPTAADQSAARSSTRVGLHMLPNAAHVKKRDGLMDIKPAAGPAAASASAFPRVRYPANLTYQGGAVVTSAFEHPVYLMNNTTSCGDITSCWGNVGQFLTDLNHGNFIHVTDQYVGTSANGRYPLGLSAGVHYTPPANPLVDADIVAIVHAVVVAEGGKGTGYGHEYHVFLPPGQDECFDTTYTACYSPDNFSTFAFCAYHGSVDFSDIGHVIYSVEPYTNVPGCSALQPDGSTPTSQFSILSHELIESITDPDGTAWWNNGGDLDLNGYEIGDECQWVNFTAPGGFLLDPVYLNGNVYYIQSEYNNAARGCTDGPLDE